MKNFVITFSLLLLSAAAFSQDYAANGFYKSFSRQFYLKNSSQYKNYNGFHSVLIKTNRKGEIVSFTPSNSMTENMKESVIGGFKGADKNAFVELKLKNKTVLFPIFFQSIEKFPDSRSKDMWSFSDVSYPSKKIVHFPPLIYMLSNRAPIVN